MTDKPKFKLPLPLWDGVERPIEVPFREPPPRFSGRLRRMLLIDEWEWRLFCLCWPTRHQAEHLYANVGGASGNCATARFNDTWGDDKHQLLRHFGDLHAAHDWIAGIGPEPVTCALPVLPVVRDPCLLTRSNRRLPEVADKATGWSLGRKEIASVHAAVDRVSAVTLEIDPDRHARECALRRQLEEQALKTWFTRKGAAE